MNERETVKAPGSTPTRRQMISGAAMVAGGLALGSAKVWAAANEEISHSEESIHQEVVFSASRKRVYDALTDAKQFHQVILLSEAKMSLGGKMSEISREAGGAFSLFGGYVTGRHIELVPGERIVQAWRAGSWDPGSYSLAKYVLQEHGAGTKIVFDHTGFPKGQADHLAAGWKSNYWEPLKKFLV